MKIFEKTHLLQSVSGIKDYTNFVVSEVNDHVVRIAVINGEYHWHEADECFMVLEGELFIDFDNGQTV